MDTAGALPKVLHKITTSEVSIEWADFIFRVSRREGVEVELSALVRAMQEFNPLDALRAMKLLIESGDERIVDLLIDWHTDNLDFSPFVSATLSPKIAQLFASKYDSSRVRSITGSLSLSGENSFLEILQIPAAFQAYFEPQCGP